jgi:hypothetical protein
MGCTWRLLRRSDGVEIFSPCFRFQATAAIENNETATYCFDVPRLKKYYAK